MTNGTSLFQSKWYHLIMATIYFLTGAFILYRGYTNEVLDNTNIIIGWVFCIYGTYRIISKLVSLKKAEKVND